MTSMEEEDMEVADTELRDLVEKTLERAGVLGRIKAELRASVFLALEDDDRWKAKRLPAKLCESTSSEPRGKGALGLVREFMEFFNLDFTLSVFDEETRPETCMSRAELIKEFDIRDVRADLPIILHLLRALDERERRSSSNVKSMDSTFTRDDNRPQHKSDVSKSFQNQDFVETKAKAAVDPLYDPFFDDPLPSMDGRNVLDNQSVYEVKQSSVSAQSKDPFNFMLKSDEYEPEISKKVKQNDSSKDHLEMFKVSTAFPSLLEDVGRENNNSLTSLKDLPSLTSASKPLSVASDSSTSWSFPKKSSLFFEDELNLSKHSGKGDGDSSDKSMIKSLMQDVMQSQLGGRSEIRGSGDKTVDFGDIASRLSGEVSVDDDDAKLDADSISGSELSMKSKLGSVLSHSSGDDDENSGSELSVRSRLESFLPDLSLDKNDLNDSQDNTEQSIEEEIDDELLSSISIGEETTNDETVSHISITGCDFMESLKQKGMIKGQK